MALSQPSTPVPGSMATIFGPGHSSTQTSSMLVTSGSTATPVSSTSSNNTFLMPNSPVKGRPNSEGYMKPKVTRTLGSRPSCLVNASITYCGNNTIFAFGGFDAYTDEVYNHVLKLDLVSHQWSLVDNYGDIPGVRMGHTATLYAGDKLLIFGGENEHRSYLSDLIIFDLKTAHWTQPAVSGPIPRGRARHAAVLHDDKLFIIGGITGHNNFVIDDVCYLDLKTFTWSRSWRFVGRFDHQAFIWGDRMWIFGGLSEDAEKVGDIYWLDLKGNPAFDSPPVFGSMRNSVASRAAGASRQQYALNPPTVVGSTGYAANSSSAQVNPASFLFTNSPQSAGAISSIKFISGANVPSQSLGMHFHLYTSGTLLDFVTPATTITPQDCCLSALDLDTLRWQRLAEGQELFRRGYRWHYATMNEDGTKVWLLGCPSDPTAADLGPTGFEEFLSDIMEIDLRRYGLLGNSATRDASRDTNHQGTMSAISERYQPQPSKGLGADFAKVFDNPSGESGTDFIITALRESDDLEEDHYMGSASSGRDAGSNQTWLSPETTTSQPIHVHKLVLCTRWPHFNRLWGSQMAEFHTKKMHIPEPYTVVRAFLYYLYTDSIHPEDCSDLNDVAGLLVMSNIYNIPHLRLLCVNRLAKELDVDHACIIWHCAGLANEEWLRRRAASFCLMYWGRVVRTHGFLKLPRSALVELSQEIDMEGRVVGGEELEVVGGLGGSRFGVGGFTGRKESMSSVQTHHLVDDDVEEEDGDMEM